MLRFLQFDMLIVFDENSRISNTWIGEYGSITNQSSRTDDQGNDYAFFETLNDEIGTGVFEFLAQNTSVEWSQLKCSIKEENVNYVSTSYQDMTEAGATDIIISNLFEQDIREAIHSHPHNTGYPSGLEWNPANPGDIQFAKWVDSVNRNVKAGYRIYIPSKNEYIPYNQDSTVFDFYDRIKTHTHK